ncbi:MAG: sugar transferase [Cyclobacteriaceae bacterium]|jgi:lipopolysaccharide/colanic/teichoic acid biosynthesis glycosyltransferase
MKRAFDFLVAAVALLVLFPVFFVLGLLVKLDSRGPVFYRQERVGRNLTIFKLWKFRSMRTDADRQAAITIGERDPRITRVGYWLRKFKLDELPQLINVLLGDMSLVGPRPEVAKFVHLYTPEQKKVLTIRPGITDWASIQFRNENALLEGKPDPIAYYVSEIMPVKLALNLQYVEKRSFWVDLTILFQTFRALFRKG